MRRERLYLHDIIKASDAIATFVEATDRNSFLVSHQQQSAFAFQFMIIGEAVRNVSDELKTRYPDVAWANARSLRNLITHRYFGIDWAIIWETATHAVPALRDQVAELYAAEFLDAGPSS